MSETKFHANIDIHNPKTPFAKFYSYVWKKNFGNNELVYTDQIVEALRRDFKEEYDAILGPYSNEAYYDIKFPDERIYALFLLKWS